MDETKTELESFRRRWQEELSARNKSQASNPSTAASGSSKTTGGSRSSANQRRASFLLPNTFDRHKTLSGDGVSAEPLNHNDLVDKDELRRVDIGKEELHSALDHYEKAVEMEGQGNLGESLSHYRKAFRVRRHIHVMSMSFVPCIVANISS
jgi:F-box protein 9